MIVYSIWFHCRFASVAYSVLSTYIYPNIFWVKKRMSAALQFHVVRRVRRAASGDRMTIIGGDNWRRVTSTVLAQLCATGKIARNAERGLVATE